MLINERVVKIIITLSGQLLVWEHKGEKFSHHSKQKLLADYINTSSNRKMLHLVYFLLVVMVDQTKPLLLLKTAVH